MTGTASRLGPFLAGVSLIFTACTADQPVDGDPAAADSAPAAAVHTPIPAGSDPDRSVAVAFSTGEERDGISTGGYRAQFAGTAVDPGEGATTPGFIGSVSAVSSWSSSAEDQTSFSDVIDDSTAWAESDFQRAAAALFEDVLPPWVFGDLSGTDRTEVTDFWISGVGIAGITVPIHWKIEEQTESSTIISVDSDFSQDNIHRGYAFTVTGTVRGEFAIDRRNPWNIEGEVVADFEIRDDNGITAARQWSRADRY